MSLSNGDRASGRGQYPEEGAGGYVVDIDNVDLTSILSQLRRRTTKGTEERSSSFKQTVDLINRSMKSLEKARRRGGSLL
jgi:hypothetical protein